MFDYLTAIPFDEASSFFVNIKKASPELPMEAPQGDALQLMTALIQAEFKSIYAYHAYSNSLRDLSHFAIAEELESHAEDELGHAEWLMRRLSVEGGGPLQLPPIDPPIPLSDPTQILQALIQLEEEGLQLWTQLHEAVGESPTKYEIEQYMTEEQHHLDELKQMLPAEQVQAAPAVPSPMVAPMAAKTAAAKLSYAEKMAKGTEHYHSDRMREMLDQLPAKVYTPESVEKIAHIYTPDYYFGSGLGYGPPVYIRGLEQMGRESRERGDVEALRGRINRAGASQAEAVEKQLIKEKRDSTAAAGALGGGMLGAIAGGGLGALADKGIVPVVLGAGLGTGAGGYLGHSIGAHLGENEGKRLVDRAYGGELSVGKKKEAGAGKERAHASLEAKFERDKHTKGERELGTGGRLLGAAAGAVGGHHLSKHLHGTTPGANAALLLGGALVGSQAGKSLGSEVGKSLDRHRYEKVSSVFRKFAEALPLQDYVAAEQAGMQQQQQAESEYFRQQVGEQAAQLQQAQEEAQTLQQQIQQLQQEQAQSQGQVQAAMQQAQMSQQSAMVNAQQAHNVASQATQQALAAQEESLKNQQLAARMRMAFQEMRGNMMNLASQDPAADVGQELQMAGQPTPPSPMEAMQAGQAPVQGMSGQDPNMQAGQGQASPEQASPDQGAAAQPAQPAPGQAKTGGAEPSLWKTLIRPRLPYAAGGALAGAGIMAASNAIGSDGLREKVDELEHGDGGFVNALHLASAKARLAASELGDSHPIGTTIVGGLLGAAKGFSMAPKLQRLPETIKNLKG